MMRFDIVQCTIRTVFLQNCMKLEKTNIFSCMSIGLDLKFSNCLAPIRRYTYAAHLSTEISSKIIDVSI